VITYLYWALVFGLAFGLVFLFASRLSNWRAAAIAAATVLLVGWAAHFFYLEQVFVKRYGGVMTIRVPEGQRHIAATWKEDNLWVENYDPSTNKCIFSEYARGNVLEGRVTIENCDPLAGHGSPAGLAAETRDRDITSERSNIVE
jgi:hypothetical protein